MGRHRAITASSHSNTEQVNFRRSCYIGERARVALRGFYSLQLKDFLREVDKALGYVHFILDKVFFFHFQAYLQKLIKRFLSKS